MSSFRLTFMVRIMCLRLRCNILSEIVDSPTAFNSLQFQNTDKNNFAISF